MTQRVLLAVRFKLAVFAFCFLLQATAAQAAQIGKFTVRSSPYVGQSEAVAFSQRLGERGFHPVIRSEKSNGDDFFFLEMGVFENMDQALELVFLLRSQNFDFFVVGSDGTGGETSRGALVQPDKMARIFPGQTGPSVDQISLLEDIVVNNVPTRDEARKWTGGTGPDSGFVRSRKLFAFDESRKELPTISSVAMRLRDVAWSLRSEGRDVIFDGEEATTQTGAGVLVGIYEQRNAADDLADELASYGYDSTVQEYTTADGDRYLVYALADDLPEAMSIPGQPEPKGTGGEDLLKLGAPRRAGSITPPAPIRTDRNSPIGE